MDKECEELLEKIQSMAKDATSKLRDELYPQKLGQRTMMQASELRLVVIAKYEGMGMVLEELGADVKSLEKMIELESNKTLEGKY